MGELWYPRTAPRLGLDRGLDALEHDWQVYRTLPFASEFAGAAIVAGQHERASTTVEVLREAGGIFSVLARAVSPGRIGSDSAIPLTAAAIRELLRTEPRDPLSWLDLAKIQFCSGHANAARKSVDIAVQLAPTNRYVLRAAATFFVAIGESDRALHLLRPSASELQDPWLVSAEIAISEVGGGHSRLTRKSRRLLEREVWDARSASELSAEIGTLELGAGNRGSSKLLFEAAFISPTENSVAQAASLAKSNRSGWLRDLVEDQKEALPHAAEALAYHCEVEGDFPASLVHATQWLDDQPYSWQAANYASYMASTGVGDWSSAADLARRGLFVYPRNALLSNNLAYALIEAGDLREASRVLSSAERESGYEEFEAVSRATRGLLAYRTGLSSEGGRLYDRGVQIARRLKDKRIEAIALSQHAREVKDPVLAKKLLRQAKAVLPKSDAIAVALYERSASLVA